MNKKIPPPPKSEFFILKKSHKKAIPKTHGLRHTTSTIYRKHGASKEDMRELFAHSSASVTERYLHGEGSNLKRVAGEIRLFDKKTTGTDPNPPAFLPEANKNRTKFRLIRCN